MFIVKHVHVVFMVFMVKTRSGFAPFFSENGTGKSTTRAGLSVSSHPQLAMTPVCVL